MEAQRLLLVCAALSFPWWGRVVRGICQDVLDAADSDGEPLETLPVRAGRAARRPADHGASRAPLNRVLAFQAVERRSRARVRWQGGFGRRGL